MAAKKKKAPEKKDVGTALPKRSLLERADKALWESEERFRTILNSMQFGIVIIDAQTHTILDANEKALSMIGGGTDVILGSVCHRFICPAGSGRCPVTDLGQTVDSSERVLLTLRGEKIPILKSVIATTLGGKKVLIESFIDITDRKRAEEALRDSEVRFRTMINWTYDWEYWIDQHRKFIYISPSVEHITGYHSDEFIADSELIDRIMYPDDLEVWVAHTPLHVSIEDIRPAEIEFRIIHKDGSVRWIGHTCRAIFADDGTWAGRRISNRDITDRKQAEEAKRESEERYRTLAEASPDQIFIIGKDDTMKYANIASLKMFRLPYDQVIGKSRKDLFPPAIADAQGILLQKVFETGEPVRKEEIIQFGKQEFWIDTNLVPLKDVTGNVTEVLGVSRDITERKHMEEKLHENELRYRSLFEGAAEGILVADIDTKKFLYANPAMCRMLGYSEGELTNPGVEDIHPKESLDFVIGEFIAQSRGEKLMARNIPLLRKDKTILYADISTTHIFIDGGMRNVGFFSDITDRKRAEDLLKQFNEELEQKVKSRTEELNTSLQEKVILLREIHHRVKNNLQIIISLINLQMRQIDDKQMKQIMAETQHRVRAMSLVYEKLSQSENLSRIDFSDYTRFLASQLFSYYEVNFQKVALEIAIENVMLDINTAIPLGLIINELVSNALKYAFLSDRKGTITISSQYDNKVLTLVIKDDGIGLPPDLDWKNQESLGLRLVNNLVEQLNGTIKVERESGTTFIISMNREIG
jgi:PAS domain S-box-containing protein